MKILRIRLNNLNSLRGEHKVDFTSEPLASTGLFAITGPTGAGKTTLLDAITLALYGKAARYGNESNPEHVMSGHTGECLAEVEFEAGGHVYRAVWERHRARKKADGSLQQPKRNIYDAAGTPLTQNIREAEEKIEALLGLNYDRFLRSVLLAQGEFARFLKANANERAELLESLTGTTIYSQLGRLAFEEANRRELEVRDKETALLQIVTLEESARKELEDAIHEGKKAREELAKEVKGGSEMLLKISSLENARTREKTALRDQEKLQQDKTNAADHLELLRRHRLTLPFADGLGQLEAAEKHAADAQAQEQAAKEHHESAKSILIKLNFMLRASLSTALETHQEAIKQENKVAGEQAEIAKEAREWLDEHTHDAALADHLTDVVEAVGELKLFRTSLRGGWNDWKSTAKVVLPTDAEALPTELETAAVNNMEKLLREFLAKAEQKGLDLESDTQNAKKILDEHSAQLEKKRLIATLEQHRQNLKPGEECPLCGALDHPFGVELKVDSELAAAQANVQVANQKFDELKNSKRVHFEKVQDLVDEKGNVINQLKQTTAHFESVDVLLKPLGVKAPQFGEEDVFRNGLKLRERTYKENVKKEADALKLKQESEGRGAKAQDEVVTLRGKIGNLDPLPEGFEINLLPGEKKLPVSDAEKAYTTAVQDEKTKAGKAEERIKDTQRFLARLNDVQTTVETAVANSEFKTLVALRGARIPQTRAAEIERLENDLKRRANACEALLTEARKVIAELLEATVLEGNDAEAFKGRQRELNEQAERLLREQIIQQQQISADDKNRKARKEKEKELEETRANLVVWKLLRELIGSHDGSKFRKFAQAISLNILIRHANRHLGKLSDRYRICRDEEIELHLQIEDLHQANVRRPMASLSGGESFLASLALALGLSDLAGRSVRIDSLFIDEGFGSLDPETLEVAIAALESLRQHNKTVGVISHVELLKERITTQIVVEKTGGGSSRIHVVPEAASL